MKGTQFNIGPVPILAFVYSHAWTQAGRGKRALTAIAPWLVIGCIPALLIGPARALRLALSFWPRLIDGAFDRERAHAILGRLWTLLESDWIDATCVVIVFMIAMNAMPIPGLAGGHVLVLLGIRPEDRLSKMLLGATMVLWASWSCAGLSGARRFSFAELRSPPPKAGRPAGAAARAEPSSVFEGRLVPWHPPGRMWTLPVSGRSRRRLAESLLPLGCVLLAACAQPPEPQAPESPPPIQAEADGSGAAPTAETQLDTHRFGASVFVVNHVEDFDAFMKFFEEGTAERANAGIRGQLLSKLDDGRVLVHFVADDVERVDAALKSERLDSYLNRGGAPGASIVWLAYNELVTMPATPPSGQTFSLLLRFPVNDFATFKRGFEARHAVYAEQSVIGEGLHQSTVDDGIAILHFVGTDRKKLEALPQRPEFGELLTLAGYQGTLEPMVAVDMARSRPVATPEPPTAEPAAPGASP